MITNIDDNFGLLVRRLDELGLADNTIVVFMTDNGTATGVELDAQGLPQEGPGSFNAGMRGKKGSPYDGGHRVPFLLRYPGAGAGGGRDVEQLTSYVDFMPTILDLCGVTPPPHRSFHGRSLTPLVRGEDDGTWAQRILVADTQRIANPAKWRLSSVMRGPWRLVHGLELYHLGDDPGQRRDIAADHPELVAELRAGYEQWWELVSAQFDRDVPMVIGQDAEPVRLTTHDMPMRRATAPGISARCGKGMSPAATGRSTCAAPATTALSCAAGRRTPATRWTPASTATTSRGAATPSRHNTHRTTPAAWRCRSAGPP